MSHVNERFILNRTNSPESPENEVRILDCENGVNITLTINAHGEELKLIHEWLFHHLKLDCCRDTDFASKLGRLAEDDMATIEQQNRVRMLLRKWSGEAKTHASYGK